MASTNPIPAPGENGASGAAKKIGSSSIWVPGPALTLLLLLLLPPPLLGTGSFLHRLPAWRNFHRGTRHYRSKEVNLKTCESAFNIYFLLDTSETAKEYWEESQRLVEEMLKRFTNPVMRMAIVTYSSKGHTHLPLTQSRKKFETAINGLKTIELAGENLMETGFVKINEELQKEYYMNPRVNSLIIAVTTAPLKPSSVPIIKSEAEKARSMKGSVYFMAYNDYDRKQLVEIAGRSSYVYGTKTLEKMDVAYQTLVANSCNKLKAQGTHLICLLEYYDVEFERQVPDPSNLENFVCEYIVDGEDFPYRKAVGVSSNNIICPGFILEREDQEVIVRYSIDGGKRFQGNMVFQGTDCGDPLRSKEALETTTESTTTMEMTTTPTTTTWTPTTPTTTTWMPTMPTTTTWTPTTPTTTTTAMRMTTRMTTSPRRSMQRTMAPTVVTWQMTKTTVALPETTVPVVAPEKSILDKSLLYPVLLAPLLIIPVVICCICCCTNCDKQPQAVHIIQREPDMCIHTCSMVLVPCRFQEDNMRRIEGKLDTLCDFVQSCNQVPLMWYQPKRKVCYLWKMQALSYPPCIS